MRARTKRTSGVAAVVASIAIVCARDARADDTASVAAATVLFDEAVTLMDAGRADEACPKLVRSQALAPSGGTLLALGECYEKTGKTASAWLAFREAASRAASAGKSDAESQALQRASQLAGSLRRMTVTVTPAAKRVAGLEVKRDGLAMKDAELGVAVPVDPGPHTIEAEAPNAEKWSDVVTIESGQSVEVTIPAPAPRRSASARNADAPRDAPKPDAPKRDAPTRDVPAPSASDSTESPRRVAGLVVVGVGAASLVASGVLGLLAKSANDDAEANHCPHHPRCDAEGIRLTDDAKGKALGATILFVVGATGLATGGALFFTAPRPGTGSLRVTPTWGARGVGASATLVW
jgi:hypothetical protein